MKILKFHINGFGIFSDAGAELSEGLNVFHGENESGKTTLMNFFRRLLFSRGRNARNRTNPYDPVGGGVHGGWAPVRMEDGREYILTVEGAKSLAAPADGGPARELGPDFFSVSREVYESVFAMGLEEMQSLEPLNSSEVAARFFAAGAGLGSASLPGVLSALEARQNEIYRPSGNIKSASAVNRLLVSMSETDGELRQLRERGAQWRAMKDELEALEASLGEKKRALAGLNGRAGRLDLLEKGRCSLAELKEINRQLSETGELHPFPEGGLNRLERLGEERRRVGAAAEGVSEKLAAAERARDGIQSDPILRCLEFGDEVEGLEHESEQFRSAIARHALLGKEVGEGEKVFLDNLRHLCSWWTEEHLAGADVSASAIDYARKTAESRELLERAGGEEKKSIAQWDRLREDRRSEAASLEREMARVEKRAERASQRWGLITALRSVFHELGGEEEDLAALEEARTALGAEREACAAEEPPAPGALVSIISCALLAVGAGATYQAWQTSDRIWFFGAAVVFSASLLLYLAHRDQEKRYETALSWWSRRMDDLDLRMEETLLLLDSQRARVERLAVKRDELADALGIRAPRFVNEMEELLDEGERDNSASERFALLGERSRQMAAVLARMDAESEAMESSLGRIAREQDRIMEEWGGWLEERRFDPNLAPRDMEALVPRILQLRSEKAALESRRAEMNGLGGYIASVTERIARLGAVFIPGGVEDPGDPASIRALAVTWRRAAARKRELEAAEKDIRSLEGVLGSLRRELEENSVAAADLFALAGTSDEAGFRELAARWAEKERLKDGASRERQVLLGLFGTEDELARAERELEALSPEAAAAERREVMAAAAALGKEMEKVSEARGRIALRVEQIGSDERPGELLFNRKGMERRLAGGVEEWLSVILARRFLETAKEKHERERQPEVIRRAGKYLALMTGNRYTLLSSGGRQGLSVILEGNDPARRRKEEIKWSSGLADQVYLSMRLALATMWGESSEPLPLILDDLLVRFDENRRRGAAEAVIEAARKNQVMLFTCQRKTMEIFRDAAEARGSAPAWAMFHHIDHGTLIPA